MPVPDGEQFSFYHGTGGGIEGGKVRPNWGLWGPGAYASANVHEAIRHARDRAGTEGRLFGTVYEVEPVSDPIPTRDYDVRDEEGLTVKRAVGFPKTRGVRDQDYLKTPEYPADEDLNVITTRRK